MKLSLFAATLFLLLCAEAKSAEIGGEGGFYYVKLKNQKSYRTGYDLWNGKKRGFFYNLFIGKKFKIKKGSVFKVSIVSGTTKLPFVNAFTPIEDRLFPYQSRTFDIRELYLRKRHFILENLTLTAGKSRFNFSPVFNDYLWGGKFSYRLKDNLWFNYYQIAGYEGKYLLLNGESEDDVDIFGPEIVWKKGKYVLSAAAIRISDARGNEKGINKNNLILRVKSENEAFDAAVQNGKWGFYGKWENNLLKLEGCAFEKGFTSYGYREGVPDFGVIYHPAVSDLKALRVALKKTYGEFRLFPYVAVYNKSRIEGGSKLLVGSEKSNLFLTAAMGDGDRWGFFTGYSWKGIPQFPFKRFQIPSFKLKNYFDIAGEYANFPQHFYNVQSGYEGWNTAKHVGYWHSTYKLTMYSDRFTVKVSTGRNSKTDYVIWGNTADNFLYQKNAGKLWHFEEAYISIRQLKAGLQNVKIPGFIDANLSGLRYSFRALSGGAFAEREGGHTVKYLFAQTLFKNFGVSGLLRKKESEKDAVAGLHVSIKGLRGGFLREWNRNGSLSSREWGGFLKFEGAIKNLKVNALYEVYSTNFETFGMKEFFRNVSYIYRPGESNIRFLKLLVKKNLELGRKKIDRLKPEIGFIYDRLTRFSGSYVGEETGIILSLKPGKFCKLSLIGTVGTNHSFCNGLNFQVKW